MYSLLALLYLVGCAAPADRTKQLLELDLANRSGAIASLESSYSTEPAAWRAYSLGVLHGANGEYETMNQWFGLCREAGPEHDDDIEAIRLGHWRDEARAGDAAATRGEWAAAADRFQRALLAAPEKKTTRTRFLEARVLAYGPGLEEVRALVAAERPEAVYRWLEAAAAEDQAASRLATRVRLDSQLRRADEQPGDALAAFTAGELARLDADWEACDRLFDKAESLDLEDHRHRARMREARHRVGTHLLQQALTLWTDDHVATALAKLDTADRVDPERADVFTARRNITSLDGARTPSKVAEVLSLGDLDHAWLTAWMGRLYTEGRLRPAGMVADHMLNHPELMTPSQRSRALRVRVAHSRSSGDLDQARDDLRELLAEGGQLPVEAVILGDVLLAQSKYEEARHRFEQARAWGDDSSALLLRLARVAFSQEDFKTMRDQALEALDREPENAEAAAVLADARRLLDEGGAP